MKTALVYGAGGFIGSHMVKRLKSEGYWVRGVDLKKPEFSKSEADEFIIGDLRDKGVVSRTIHYSGKLGNYYQNVPNSHKKSFDEIYQFAADMGGAGFIFTGENDADIMHNSVSINLNLLDCLDKANYNPKIFYSSSACMYPAYNQEDPDNPNCKEDSAYPAAPDSEYGWEKLFSERLYLTYARNKKFNVRIARYHNIYGPEGTWDGGREKAPAAMCRKIARLNANGGEIEVWGDGEQTRSFLYIDDCIEATRRLMESEYMEPVNIGSEEMVTINQLIDIVADVSGKEVIRKHITGPLGVRGRNSDNELIRSVLNWDYEFTLRNGIEYTYNWIQDRVNEEKKICD